MDNLRDGGGLYAVIPASVMYDERLRPSAKLLYGEIVRRASGDGYCDATNRELCVVGGLKPQSVSELVNQLRDAGHVRVDIIRNGETGEILSRRIFVCMTLADIFPNSVRSGPAGGYPEKTGYLSGKNRIPIRKKPDTYPEKTEGIKVFSNIYTPYNPPEGGNAKKIKNDIKADIKKAEEDELWKRFDQFWEVYPKKQNKVAARRAWKKLKPDMDLCMEMGKALALQKRSEQWLEDDGRYIPHPATWLNGRQWENEVRVSESDREPDAPDDPRRGRSL
mgnify:CR=1 FL=1